MVRGQSVQRFRGLPDQMAELRLHLDGFARKDFGRRFSGQPGARDDQGPDRRGDRRREAGGDYWPAQQGHVRHLRSADEENKRDLDERSGRIADGYGKTGSDREIDRIGLAAANQPVGHAAGQWDGGGFQPEHAYNDGPASGG